MSQNTWVETLVTQVAAGTSFASYTTAKSVINPQALDTLAPGFWTVGKAMEIDVHGEVSNVVTNQCTFTFQVMMGTISVFSTGAILSSTTAHTTLPFNLHILLTCRAVGSATSANLMGTATLGGRAFIDLGATADITTSGHPHLVAPEVQPAVGTGFDSTISNVLDFFVGLGASDPANLVKISQYVVKALN